MSQESGRSESEQWQRKFAMSCNNRAWQLSVQARSLAQDREMLSTAHASAWHWAQVGTELNRMRATMLLAEVHALLGLGPSAFAFASEVRDYFLGQDRPDWEIGFTHAIYAHAAWAAGNTQEHQSGYLKAAAAIGKITEDEDRALVARTFAQVPVP